MTDILVVEDSRMVSSFLRHTLENDLGVKVTVARTYKEARAVMEKRKGEFFLALLDLNLPDAPDGEIVDLALAFDIPGVVLTAVMNKEVRTTIVAKGIVDYVLKSRDAPRQVVDIVRRLIRNREVTVLLVDDSEFLRRTISGMLVLYGFTLLEAANGVEALKVLAEHPEVSLVVTDYEMDRMDGFTLCSKIRETYPRNKLAVIGVSSFDDELLSVKFIKNGANDFLAKPFQREELYWRIVQNLETLDYIEQINESLDTIGRMNQRMKRDLDAAARLQQRLLPTDLPQVEGFVLASLFKPCDELAGDTFNAFWLDQDRLCLYVLDVSGHGVPSALLSVTLAQLLSPDVQRSSLLVEEADCECGYRILTPSEVCVRLNRQFPMDLETFQYFTIVYGILDIRRSTFTFTTAGHSGPLHLMPGCAPVSHKTAHPAIGLAPKVDFTEQVIELGPGDRLFFYTDGIVESQNGAKEEFGLARLGENLKSGGDEELGRCLGLLLDNLAEWNNNTFKDDVTILALECTREPDAA